MMANISAGMVKELREKTGAGMMDCKAALSETAGEMEAAVDWLRKKGLSRAAKKAGRVAAEGLIGVALAPSKGVIVEVNSETDFVARNEQFQMLVRNIGTVVLNSTSFVTGPQVEDVRAAEAGFSGGTVGDAISSAIATIGENISLRRVSAIETAPGGGYSYMHNQIADGLGKIGVLVGLKSRGKPDELAALGRMLAMHIAAANPQAIDAARLDPALVAREKDILADKFRQQGKPAAMIDKIVESGLKTFYKEVCLLDQAFIHEPTKTVGQMLKDAEARVGDKVEVASFTRYALGEGIEKTDSPDFASEVAAAAGQA
jgi:elongation factor Ts